jgi:hypothetical protein
MQKAFIIQAAPSRGKTDIELFNEVLADGWKVVAATAMPSTTVSNEIYGTSYPPTCLVVVEKP